MHKRRLLHALLVAGQVVGVIMQLREVLGGKLQALPVHPQSGPHWLCSDTDLSALLKEAQPWRSKFLENFELH